MLDWFSIQILVNFEVFKLSLNLCLTYLRAQIACYEWKGDLSPTMLKEIFHDSMKGFVWKTIPGWLGGKSCFFHTNPSNFRRPLQSLILMALSDHANKIFQKQTAFVFTESWSRDQLLQKAYHRTSWCIKKVPHYFYWKHMGTTDENLNLNIRFWYTRSSRLR